MLTKEQVLEIIQERPKSYVPFLKKNFPDTYNAIALGEFASFGENLFNFIYPHSRHTCVECGERCSFKQFSHGYYEFCSYSCRAKNKKSYLNAHNEDGSIKESVRSKNAKRFIETSRKREETCEEKYGQTLQSLATASRARKYQARIPDVLKDKAWCSVYSKSLVELATELNVPYSMVLKQFRNHGISRKRSAVDHLQRNANSTHI